MKLFSKLLFICWLTLVGLPLCAQQKKTTAPSKSPTKEGASTSVLTPEEVDEYKQRIASLVEFYEFALNLIGNDSTATEDKEVIINRSYLKFFKDNKVQIEDDLDQHRIVKTYKGVQAYLQDVDYFFKYVSFDLNTEEIVPHLNDPANLYFKVSITRYIKGTTSDGDSVSNSQKRYIEVNVDHKQKDIKIASVYSTPLDEKQELFDWWNLLPEEWKQLFRNDMGVQDSINYGQLKRLMNTQEINLSNNKTLMDITPLNRMGALKNINISNTNIYDLLPLRNLSNLEVLNCDGTLIKSFEPLKYTVNLKELSFNNSKVDTLAGIGRLINLETLSFENTGVRDLSPLAALSKLRLLNCRNTKITHIRPLQSLKKLEYLDLSATKVLYLDPIAKMLQLEVLKFSNTSIFHLTYLDSLLKLKRIYFDNTGVQTLADLKALPKLERIYCDNTKVAKEEAIQFMALRTGCLVVMDTKAMMAWWTSLSADWKKVFRNYAKVDDVPTIDQLARLQSQQELDIANNEAITDIEPLKVFYNLKTLNLKGTPVVSLEALRTSNSLEELDISNSRVNVLTPLHTLNRLKTVYCDHAPLDSNDIFGLRRANSNCVVVYRSEELRSWWSGVPDEWREVFRKHYRYDDLPDDKQLHILAGLDSISISDNLSIKNLSPLIEMDMLRVLKFTNTKISDLAPLAYVRQLQVLNCSKNPVRDLTVLSKLTALRSLTIENTGVSELEPIANLPHIEILNLSGSLVKDLEDIEHYTELQTLDISSTAISSLKPLEKMQQLQLLKCFNTKLSPKRIENFKKLFPTCEVIYY